jgi:aryl-alcohol dehydrogenase-like predicted oxidoreductase
VANNNFGIIARMPLQFGLLTGKFNRNAVFPHTDHRSFRLTPEILKRSLKELEPVWSISEKYNIGYDSFALSFILSHPEISTVIPGIKTPEQASANINNICDLDRKDVVFLHKLYEERFCHLLEFMKQNG